MFIILLYPIASNSSQIEGIYTQQYTQKFTLTERNSQYRPILY